MDLHGRAHDIDALFTRIEELERQHSERLHGVYYARVTNIDDPLKQGRIRVRFHWLEEPGSPKMESDWMVRCVEFMGPTDLRRNRKFGIDWPLPEVGSLVVIAFNGGDRHDGVFFGQPQYIESGLGAPPLDKDPKKDWSFRMDLQNGYSLGIDTEGNKEETIPGNHRLKVLGSAFHSARGVMTTTAVKLRHVALSVLRTVAVTHDQTNYPRPDEAGELREMNIDAMSGVPGYQDPGIDPGADLGDEAV